MEGPARLRTKLSTLALFAIAAAAQTAAATDRYKPANAGFVVAQVANTMPDAELRGLVTAWHDDREAEAPALALAEAFLARARSLREPMYMGRAEAVLAPLATRAGASDTARRLYAETLQYRHDFPRAEALLDDVLGASPRDTAARAMRASIRLVRGEFENARADCAQLITSREAGAIGAACFAEALAGLGQIDRANAMLGAFAPGGGAAGYLLTVRGELRERARDLDGAIVDYRAALAAAPNDDSTRASLADALAARGEPQAAFETLDVERPSVALLVRQAAYAPESRRAELRARASAWLELEISRGDALHNREAAMLALVAGDNQRALTAARANFEVQRELPDVRVLARAATAARDAQALQHLNDWLRTTGFHDAVTATILGTAPRG